MRKLIALVTALLAAAPASAQRSDTLPKIRVLFIGNSYTFFNDLPRTLQTLALMREQPVAVEVATVWAGGASLKRHWDDNHAASMIRRGQWNFVVLQDQSLMPITNPAATIDYGKLLGKEITAVGAKPLLFLTWARKGRPAATQDSLTRTYDALAREIGGEVVPAGPIWAELQKIDHSLELYFTDGQHPGPIGSYAAAVGFYRAIFKEMPSVQANLAWATTPSASGPWERVYPFRVWPKLRQDTYRAVNAVMAERSR